MYLTLQKIGYITYWIEKWINLYVQMALAYKFDINSII